MMGNYHVRCGVGEKPEMETSEAYLSLLRDEDRIYIRDNPYSGDYHFGYALYIRNHYIHCKDFSEVDFWVDADHLSGQIMEYIFSLLLPDEYIYNESFSEQLFGHKEFIGIRKGYKEIYGEYPVDTVKKYRSLLPEEESKYSKLDITDLITMDIPEDEYEADIEASERDREQREKCIKKLIKELAERVWDIEGIKQVGEECGVDDIQLDIAIANIKKVFLEEQEYIPMTTALMTFRDAIGEERYAKYRELLSAELEKHPKLMEYIDKTVFKDRQLAKVVMKHSFAMELLPEYQDDDEMVRYALEHDGDAINYVNKRYLRDRKWVRLAIEHSEKCIILRNECMKPYRSDKELAYLACNMHKWNYVYIDEAFHDDYELAYKMISDNEDFNNVYNYMSDRLKDDLTLALIDAAGKFPDVQYYSERLRDNDEIAEKIAEVHGSDSFYLDEMSERIKEKYGYGKDE